MSYSENPLPLFRVMLVAQVSRTAAPNESKNGHNLHTVVLTLASFIILQCSTWQRDGLGASILKNSGDGNFQGCSSSTTRGSPCLPFHSRKSRRRRGLSDRPPLLPQSLADVSRDWSIGSWCCVCALRTRVAPLAPRHASQRALRAQVNFKSISPQQQAGPAFLLDSPDQHHSTRPIGRDHTIGLSRQQPR
jgi:hypothetical protein